MASGPPVEQTAPSMTSILNAQLRSGLTNQNNLAPLPVPLPVPPPQAATLIGAPILLNTPLTNSLPTNFPAYLPQIVPPPQVPKPRNSNDDLSLVPMDVDEAVIEPRIATPPISNYGNLMNLWEKQFNQNDTTMLSTCLELKNVPRDWIPHYIQYTFLEKCGAPNPDSVQKIQDNFQLIYPRYVIIIYFFVILAKIKPRYSIIHI